jgi:hypothetical protein
VSLTANFQLKTYTIAASAGANGTLSPNGNITVNHGANQTFSFSANNDYEIDQVLIDGTSNVAAVAAGSYAFENVTENHTISVSFSKKNRHSRCVGKFNINPPKSYERRIKN